MGDGEDLRLSEGFASSALDSCFSSLPPFPLQVEDLESKTQHPPPSPPYSELAQHSGSCRVLISSELRHLEKVPFPP